MCWDASFAQNTSLFQWNRHYDPVLPWILIILSSPPHHHIQRGSIPEHKKRKMVKGSLPSSAPACAAAYTLRRIIA
jgi:hypothetical protein